MLNLLYANFRRLFKSKLLYLGSLTMFVIVILYSVALYVIGENSYASVDNFVITLPSIALIPTLGMAIYIFGANFMGKDFEYLTIKNKIIIGNSKTKIYLASLIATFSAGIIFYVVYYLGVLTIGMILVGHPLQMLKINEVFSLLGYQLLLILTYSSIVTAVTYISRNKTFSVVFLIVLAVILMTVGYSLLSRLNQPEYYINYDTGEKILNTSYIAPGSLRSFLTFIVNFFPSTSSCYFMISSSLNLIPLLTITIYALIFIILSTIIGIYLFNKSNLK